MDNRRYMPQSVLPIALSAVACLGLALWFIFGWGGGAMRVLDYLSFAPFAMYATVCAVLAARSAQGRSRTAWTTTTLALAAWVAGTVIRAIFALVLHRSMFPSPADFFFLVFTVLVCAAFVQFPTQPNPNSRTRLLFDALIVAGSLFVVLWAVVLDKEYHAKRGDNVALGPELLHFNLVVVIILVLVVARADVRNSVVMRLLAGAVVLISASNAAFVWLEGIHRYHAGHLTTVGSALSLACFGAAALLSRLPRPPAPPMSLTQPLARIWVPYVPLLIAGTIGPAIIMTGPLRIAVPMLMVFVCVRQVLSAREHRRLLAAAADQALRDPLTGLANRTLFQDRLAHAMALRRRDDRAVAVVSLDLDDFKLINDSLGHPAADSLLIRVGERIASCVRRGDTVARLGGDEFALLLEGGLDQSHLVTERVVEAFDKPFVIDGQEIPIRPSVGMAVTTSADAELASEDLVKRADIAMYIAKRSRNAAVHTFSADMALLDPDLVELTNRWSGQPAGNGAAQVRLLGELRRAIDGGGLDVVYQPKLELRSGRITGVEALLRWPHPLLGVLRPSSFLPLVLRHGLMRPMTDLVLNKVLDDAARWVSMSMSVPVAVNLFAPLLRDAQLPDVLRQALHERGLPADLLTVEITEDLVLDDLGRVTEVLRRLREHGVHVAIDDFGSGFSALSYLRDLPIDEVKFDRHFIISVAVDPKAAAVVSAIIDLNHDLGITVVAEGVEDGDTAEWLRVHGCDIGQGYYYGAPVAAPEIPRLIAAGGAPKGYPQGQLPKPGN